MTRTMYFLKSFSTLLVVLLGLFDSSNAFWRMGCRSRTGLVRLDPLVSPGQLSEHIHAIHGSSGFSDTATYKDLMAGDCTSCEVAEDKSAYWHPALYFKDAATGKFTLVPQIGGMLAYYLLNTNAGNTSLSSFPAGFQMIAGDTNQRNFSYPVPDVEKSYWNQYPYNTQAFLRQAALGFNCLNYGIAPEGSLYRHFLPDKAYLDQHCVDGVRFELMFPSCWNGKKEIPPNKMDHMAYPSQVMTGECPEGFTERLPSLFYETIWNTYAFKDRDGQFVIANGDPTGYGYHGDFIMGWDEDFLRAAVNTCTNLSGLTSDCPLFTIQDSSVYENCNLKTVPSAATVEKEKKITLDQLPGNLEIQPGPGYASGETAGSPGHQGKIKDDDDDDDDDDDKKSQTGGKDGKKDKDDKSEPIPPIPTLSYMPGAPVDSSEAYVPGGILNVGASPEITPAPKIQEAAEPEDTRKYFSTDYQTSGLEVVKVLWYEEVVEETHTTTTTVPPPVMQKRSHLQYHRQQKYGYRA